MENNEKKQPTNVEEARRKKLVITVLISVAVYVMILIIYMTISNITISSKTGPGAKYINQVSEYLKETYNEEFNIKFEKKRIGTNYSNIGCDGSYSSLCLGPDGNIEEYVYSFTPKNNKEIKSYVVYSYNIEEGTGRIYETLMSPYQQKELCGDEPEHDNAYEDLSKWYQEKQEIKDELKEYLGKGYTIDETSDNRNIIAKTSKTLEHTVKYEYNELERLYSDIAKMLQDKEIYVKIKYLDGENILIKSGSTLKSNYNVQQLLTEE